MIKHVRLKRLERERRTELNSSFHRNDLTKIIQSYIGQQISSIDFYEDEAVLDLLGFDKSNRFFIEDVDEKWVLIKIKTSKKEKLKLIRIASIQSISSLDKNKDSSLYKSH